MFGLESALDELAQALRMDSPFHSADAASLTLADGKLTAADGRSEPRQ
ncbi:hypothetical protein [Bradyrhizobium genosp. P]